jgi:putative thioredoxin
MSHDLQDFDRDVIAASQHTPVLVDFWAAWCGPCKMLGPIIEKLAGEAAGRWTLVKIDTDAHQDIAARFGIRGIPNLKLFSRGAVIAELGGALPEPQLRAWIEQHLPTPKRGTMARARELLQAGKSAEAAALLRPIHTAEPADGELTVLLARALVFSSPAEAQGLADSLPPASPWIDQAGAVQAIANALLHLPGANATGLERDYRQALLALQREDFHAAAEGLVEVLLVRPSFDADRARHACRALFQHLGFRHPISEEFQRRYSMAVNS